MTTHTATLIRHRRPARLGRGLTALAATAALVLGAAGSAAAQEGEGDGQEVTQEETYEVDKGDTLWDLAAEFLSDPFDWKRIYQLNRDKIEDPHWIYPGQRFLIPGRDGRVKAVTVREKDARDGAGAEKKKREPAGDGGPAGKNPFDAPSIFDSNPERRVTVGNVRLNRRERPALVSASDFYRSSFVARWEEVAPRGTTGRLIQENPLELEIPPSVRIRDQVVLALGGLDVDEGDTLQAVRPGRSVDDMRIVQSLGLVEVRNVRGDSARGVVLAVYGDYQVGHPVIPAEPYTYAARRELRAADGQLAGHVLGIGVEQALVSTGDHVYLDVGAEDGVNVGDEFAVFPSTVEKPTSALVRDRLGTVQVVRLRSGTATARVVETRDVGMDVGQAVLRVREPATPGG